MRAVCNCNMNQECQEFCIACDHKVDISNCRSHANPYRPYCGDCPKKSCFGRTNSVLMYDGTVRPIENIHPGDLLMRFDGQFIRVLYTSSSAPYYNYTRSMLCVTISDGGIETNLTLTDSHLLHTVSLAGSLVEKPAGDLKVNDMVWLWDHRTGIFRRAPVSAIRACVDYPIILLTNGDGNVIVSNVSCSSFTKNFTWLQKLMTRLFKWYINDESDFIGPERFFAQIFRWLLDNNVNGGADYSFLESSVVHYYVSIYDSFHQMIKAWMKPYFVGIPL